MPARFTVFVLSAAIATLLWLSTVHLFFRPELPPNGSALPPDAASLANQQLELWNDPALRAQELKRMRAANAEWDFMGRTFFVLSLANLSLRQPDRKEEYLAVMDAIIDETLRAEEEGGKFFFLMDYARQGDFVLRPARSIFLDGEIALMMGARQTVEVRESYRPLIAERVDIMIERMKASPVMSAESYPNECWTFCNTAALAAITISDTLDGRDHSAFISGWLATARAKLVHPQTGLLVSSYTFEGTPIDGPEGSSIWMAAHCLQVVDPEFAEDQYRRARKEIGVDRFGFGWAREWPASWVGPRDIDSGPVIPFVEVSAGASGLALLGAASFHDREYLAALMTTLNFAAFPERRDGKLRYCAGNQVGDAVLLYAMVQGPLWERVQERKRQ